MKKFILLTFILVTVLTTALSGANLSIMASDEEDHPNPIISPINQEAEDLL